VGGGGGEGRGVFFFFFLLGGAGAAFFFVIWGLGGGGRGGGGGGCLGGRGSAVNDFRGGPWSSSAHTSDNSPVERCARGGRRTVWWKGGFESLFHFPFAVFFCCLFFFFFFFKHSIAAGHADRSRKVDAHGLSCRWLSGMNIF